MHETLLLRDQRNISSFVSTDTGSQSHLKWGSVIIYPYQLYSHQGRSTSESRSGIFLALLSTQYNTIASDWLCHSVMKSGERFWCNLHQRWNLNYTKVLDILLFLLSLIIIIIIIIVSVVVLLLLLLFQFIYSASHVCQKYIRIQKQGQSRLILYWLSCSILNFSLSVYSFCDLALHFHQVPLSLAVIYYLKA